MKAWKLRKKYEKLNSILDAKNLADLQARRPDIVEAISALIEADQTPDQIGVSIRDTNPQMWVESKYAESVARALLQETGE